MEQALKKTGPLNKGNDAPENKTGRVLAKEKMNWTSELIDEFVQKSFEKSIKYDESDLNLTPKEIFRKLNPD